MCSGGFQADSTESGERLDRQRRISLGQVACQFDILSPPDSLSPPSGLAISKCASVTYFAVYCSQWPRQNSSRQPPTVKVVTAHAKCRGSHSCTL
jgi:hypothetical protein